MSRKVNGIRVDVTPQDPDDEQPVIGLIGMGAMGRMYAEHLSYAGWKRCVWLLLRRDRFRDLMGVGYMYVTDRRTMSSL